MAKIFSHYAKVMLTSSIEISPEKTASKTMRNSCSPKHAEINEKKNNKKFRDFIRQLFLITFKLEVQHILQGESTRKKIISSSLVVQEISSIELLSEKFKVGFESTSMTKKPETKKFLNYHCLLFAASCVHARLLGYLWVLLDVHAAQHNCQIP